jgi:hypothetical protein
MNLSLLYLWHATRYSLHKLIVHTGGNITYVEFNLLSFSQAVNGSSILKGMVSVLLFLE